MLKVSSHDAFISMYLALNAAYNDTRSEKVLSYLTDADPTIWTDGGSADPEIYESFKKLWDLKFSNGYASAEDSYEFVKSYLAIQNGIYTWHPGDLEYIFKQYASIDIWKEALIKLQE